jgi:hypothetical protein
MSIEEVRIDYDAYRPDHHVRYSSHWNWARDGRSSCMIDEQHHGKLVFFHTSLRAPGEKPPEPGSFSEDATSSIVYELLCGIVSEKIEEGWELVHMSRTSAVMRKPS